MAVDVEGGAGLVVGVCVLAEGAMGSVFTWFAFVGAGGSPGALCWTGTAALGGVAFLLGVPFSVGISRLTGAAPFASAGAGGTGGAFAGAGCIFGGGGGGCEGNGTVLWAVLKALEKH